VKRPRRTGADQGSAAVEFALVLPVLLLILFGIIDFGRMMNARIVISQAAHEGARAVAIGADPATVSQVVGRALGSVGADFTVVQDCAADPDGDAEVEVTYAFSYVTPLLGDGLTLTSTAVVRCQ